MFLFLDALFRKKLFRPDVSKQQTRSSLAAEEAVKAKCCLGALRYLWRNARERAHDPKVEELKQYVCPSPNMIARRPTPPSEDEAASEGEVVEEGDEEESGEEPEHCLDDGDDFVDHMVDAPSQTVEDSQPDSQPDSQADSQVKGAWMGKFYNEYATKYDTSPETDTLEVSDEDPPGEKPADDFYVALGEICESFRPEISECLVPTGFSSFRRPRGRKQKHVGIPDPQFLHYLTLIGIKSIFWRGQAGLEGTFLIQCVLWCEA